jgi:hypothetical protein
MSGLFGGGDIPSPPPPPPPPTIDRTDEIARQERARRSAAGRGSTLLTGGQGVTEESPSATKRLLGE